MAALEVQVEVDVARTPEEVWRYVAEEYFEHHSSWDPAIVGMEKLSPGPMAVGCKGREVRKFGGKQAADFEITALAPPKSQAPARFAFRNTSGPFDLERTYEIRAAGKGARLAFSFQMSPKGVMKLLFPLFRKTIASQVKENIERIPGLVAGGRP